MITKVSFCCCSFCEQKEQQQKETQITNPFKANSQNLTIFRKQEQPRLMKEGVRLSNLNALIDHNDIEGMPLEPK